MSELIYNVEIKVKTLHELKTCENKTILQKKKVNKNILIIKLCTHF